MKDIKRNMRNESEDLELRKKENQKVDFSDYHTFVNLEHCDSCCCGGNI